MERDLLDARVRFLGELGEATRDIDEPERVLEVVAAALGRHLRVSRCAYAEVEPDEDTFTIRHDYTHECRTTTGRYRLSAFGERAAGDQRAGRRLVIRDVDAELPTAAGRDTFNAIDVKAIICCPLIKAGRLVAMMAVHQTTPRDWQPDEVSLVEAVVERCWAYLERARAVRSLAESESGFRQLADAMPQIVWTARPDGVIDYYNRRWFDYIRAPEADLAGAAWDRYVHPDDLARVQEAWSRSLASGDEYVTEFRVRRADQQYRWFLVRALPVRDEQRRITRWFGTCTDIDDKKRSDEALRVSRQQMEMVVKRADVGVWYCPLPFDELIWDDKVKEHFHLPPDARVDIDLFYQRLHPDDRERTRSAIEASIATHRPYDIDYRTVSPDGEQIKWIHASGSGYYNEQGEPLRFDGITIDVTERVRAEISLRESELRFRTMSDSAPVMIWVTGADGECEYRNRRWQEFTGQPSEQAHGQAWMQAVHPDDSSRVASTYQSASRAHATFELEYRLRRRDGQYRWCADTAAPRFAAHGEFLGHIGSVIDITDRKSAEQERALLLESERAARMVAERASRMKDEFLATLSHELRTPLNAVLGWSQMLKSTKLSSPDFEKGVAVIERNARAQARIIEDLLDMSRIVSGKMRLDLQDVAVPAWVQSAIETIQPAADAKGIALTTQLDGASQLVVWGDPSRLHQVVWNLLSNAVKFTPRGGFVQVRVESQADSQLELHVIDSGEGIPSEFLPYVFDRFSQGDASSTRRYGGLGLGLAIVKQLVELHGGTIRVESQGKGHGAKFTIALPLLASEPVPELDAEQSTGPISHREPRSWSEPINLAGLHAMVVDDEPDARALLEQLLMSYGARVTTADSARAAYSLLGADSFDVMISDIGMPDEDGYSLMRRLRAAPDDRRAIPAIALTAYARPEDRAHALGAGYQVHLPKPANSSQLLAAIADLVPRARRPEAGEA